ncbi:hypothetical protein BHE90_001018 [Fusarium euwallaceae]|uniref:Uncharacterized protein n=2 Tax=Fusarium solani species complex TaxID=232080 RepID=A0A3M2SH38_9HYPO|nr:hypothetical protein CDV36_003494 [Fusarium kuroshium]RTE84439.1 hypothetical protein BHE90_001018 [Fusarium euwallaceae]
MVRQQAIDPLRNWLSDGRAAAIVRVEPHQSATSLTNRSYGRISLLHVSLGCFKTRERRFLLSGTLRQLLNALVPARYTSSKWTA